jgi:pimeloyl-ACP methyl ester carboxylesterase
MVDRVQGAAGTLAVDRYGEFRAPPIILIHGGGQTRHIWRRTGEWLATQGLYAVAPDLRGHGDSDRAPDGDYRYDRLAEDIDALIDHVGAPAILVGASVGGKAALAAAGRLPADRIAALVLIDAVPRSNMGGIARVAAILQTPTEGFASVEEAAAQLAAINNAPVEPSVVDRLRRTMRQHIDGRWEWQWDARFFLPEQKLGVAAALDYLETAARALSIPTLLMRGDRSDVVDEDGAKALGAIVAHYEEAVITDAGHQIVSEQRAQFCDILLAFLHRHFAELRTAL